MAAPKAPAATTRTTGELPVLETFYNVRNAAIRLDLTDSENPEDTGGQRWLRDGFNRPADGSKGRKFPGRYMGGQLMFSESELVVITQIALEESEARLQAKEQPTPSTGRPRRVRTTAASLVRS